jgi:hypothetical protein
VISSSVMPSDFLLAMHTEVFHQPAPHDLARSVGGHLRQWFRMSRVAENVVGLTQHMR